MHCVINNSDKGKKKVQRFEKSEKSEATEEERKQNWG